jgi:hypothetical protein
MSEQATQQIADWLRILSMSEYAERFGQNESIDRSSVS